MPKISRTPVSPIGFVAESRRSPCTSRPTSICFRLRSGIPALLLASIHCMCNCRCLRSSTEPYSPYSTVREFLILACGLENIGVSAYAGANQYISDPMYSTGLSILESPSALLLTSSGCHYSFRRGATPGIFLCTCPQASSLDRPIRHSARPQHGLHPSFATNHLMP